jgi:spore maturation protein SpmA/spore maturation protein SpmB
MNRIFFWMIAIAFLVAGYRELSWEAPAPEATEQVVEVPADPVLAEIAELRKQVKQLTTPPVEAPASPIQGMSDAIFSSTKSSVELAIGLIGVMAFFLGLMKVAETAGLLVVIAKLIRPLMIRLFPDVPPDHPAMGAMILNMSANALGLGNAATPFGIRAMQELDRLNPNKGTASNSMCLFLAINTSSVTILPTGVIAIRDALGSQDAAGILSTTLFATIFSTSVAILAAKTYQRFSSPVEATNPVDTSALPAEEASTSEDPNEDFAAASEAYPLWVSITAIGCLVAMIPLALFFGSSVSPWLVPLLAVGLLGYGHVKGVAVYEVFVEGARDGFQVAIKIIPYLVAILASVAMFRASGALNILVNGLSWATEPLGMPAEALPMALLRPLSGSGAYGIMAAIMQEHGPDSYAGYIVSTLQGSTETTFYVIAVYFGAIQVKRTRHAMPAALTADFAGIVGAIIACQIYFRMNGL